MEEPIHANLHDAIAWVKTNCPTDEIWETTVHVIRVTAAGAMMVLRRDPRNLDHYWEAATKHTW